jgi:hypothetical protein
VAVAHRGAVVAARVSTASKARLAQLAALQGLSESSLLALMVDAVVAQNADNLWHAEGSVTADVQPRDRADNGTHTLRHAEASSEDDDQTATGDRVTLRLRPGDRLLVYRRAAARGMRPASYLVALVHSHVRSSAALPTRELRDLKQSVSELSAVRRSLDRLRMEPSSSPLDTMRLLHETAAQVEDVRRHVADVVRANLISWEAPDA